MRKKLLGRFDGIMHHGWAYMVVLVIGGRGLKGDVWAESVGRGKAQLGKKTKTKR